MNTKEIREAAERATQRPAGNIIRNDLETGEIEWIVQEYEGGDYAVCQRKSVAQLLALLDPATVLALCREIKRLQEENAAGFKQLQEADEIAERAIAHGNEQAREIERLRERVKELEQNMLDDTRKAPPTGYSKA